MGKNIKDIKVKKNITQEELAEKSNVIQQAISKCETDDKSRMNKIEYEDGNTIIRINEHFSETGRKLTDCIESMICYESKYNKHE